MKHFILTMFSESGEVSFSRVITALIVSFVLGWDTNYAVHFHAIPPAAELLGQAGFMGIFYGINKSAAALSKDGNAPQEK